jgi:ATP-binding cassette subfamily B protein
VLAVEPSVQDGSGEIKPISGAPCIEFKNVSLTYPRSKVSSIENVNLSIKTGETVGIIGGTGSGKSTLISLIPRFYDTTEGEILIDGVNVKEYTENQLREKIAIVQQRAALFSGTIADNMRMAKPDATLEEMQKAADIAQASEFINRLERGFDTQVSQGGNNLSGGQKQRLTIARALIKNSPILILDDSASALDYATDADLRRAIRENTDNQTVIIVSQRVNSVKDADKIVVLDDGEIVGTGTHSELVKSCEIYHEICYSQEQLGGVDDEK